MGVMSMWKAAGIALVTDKHKELQRRTAAYATAARDVICSDLRITITDLICLFGPLGVFI